MTATRFEPATFDPLRSEIDTPLGRMVAAATDGGIVELEFDRLRRGGPARRRAGTLARVHLMQLADEIAAYFAGRLTAFTVPLDPPVGTPFQTRAWEYLRSIPFGQTRSYGRQAAAMGVPAASRAVGGANGANPLCLLVPCHRVVGADGSLTGFAAGVDRKRWLLDHERRLAVTEALTLFA